MKIDEKEEGTEEKMKQENRANTRREKNRKREGNEDKNNQLKIKVINMYRKDVKIKKCIEILDIGERRRK